MFFWKPHYATEYRKNTDLLIGCIVQCIITLVTIELPGFA